MTAPNPPTNLQVVDPTPAAAPQDFVDPGPAEDRILSPEETENFFKTGSIDPVDTTPGDNTDTPEQAAMAADHFAQVQGEPAASGAQITPPRGPNLPPGVVPAGQMPPAQQVQQPGVLPQPGVQPQVQPGQPGVVPAVLPSPQEAALQAQVQQLTGQVQALTTAMQQPQPQQQRPQQGQQQPKFNFQVPQQYAEAIASEDPNLRAQAIGQLLNGVAESVNAQTLREVDQRLNTITPAITQQVQQAQSVADIKRDMYGTYPELSGMQDMVVAAATQLQTQFPGGWSPDYRDAIAERLSPLVNGLSQKVSTQRANRGFVPVAPQQQFLPQGPPQGLPPGVFPVQVQGGVHQAPAAPQQGQPVLVRDAAGNYSQVYPQQGHQAGPQARPGAQGQVDPGLQDIWSTFGY